MQQVHNLSHPCPTHVTKASQLRLVGDYTVAEEAIESPVP
jgi:hypothetical protein